MSRFTRNLGWIARIGWFAVAIWYFAIIAFAGLCVVSAALQLDLRMGR